MRGGCACICEQVPGFKCAGCGRGVRSVVALTFALCVPIARQVDKYQFTDVMPRQDILALPWHLPVTCRPSLCSQRRRMPHTLRSGTPRPVRMLVQPGIRGGGGVRGGRKHLRQTTGHPPSRDFLRDLCLRFRLRVGGPEHLARHAVHHHRASPCKNSRTHLRARRVRSCIAALSLSLSICTYSHISSIRRTSRS